MSHHKKIKHNSEAGSKSNRNGSPILPSIEKSLDRVAPPPLVHRDELPYFPVLQIPVPSQTITINSKWEVIRSFVKMDVSEFRTKMPETLVRKTNSKWELLRAVILPVTFYRGQSGAASLEAKQHRLKLMQNFMNEKLKQNKGLLHTFNLFSKLIELKEAERNLKRNQTTPDVKEEENDGEVEVLSEEKRRKRSLALRNERVRKRYIEISRVDGSKHLISNTLCSQAEALKIIRKIKTNKVKSDSRQSAIGSGDQIMRGKQRKTTRSRSTRSKQGDSGFAKRGDKEISNYDLEQKQRNNALSSREHTYCDFEEGRSTDDLYHGFEGSVTDTLRGRLINTGAAKSGFKREKIVANAFSSNVNQEPGRSPLLNIFERNGTLGARSAGELSISPSEGSFHLSRLENGSKTPAGQRLSSSEMRTRSMSSSRRLSGFSVTNTMKTPARNKTPLVFHTKDVPVGFGDYLSKRKIENTVLTELDNINEEDKKLLQDRKRKQLETIKLWKMRMRYLKLLQSERERWERHQQWVDDEEERRLRIERHRMIRDFHNKLMIEQNITSCTYSYFEGKQVGGYLDYNGKLPGK